MNTWPSLASALTLVLFALSVPSLSAQEPEDPDEWVRYLGRFVEGPGAISQNIRSRILQQPEALDFFADLLQQRQIHQSPWRAESALFWLAQSGDPKFVPVLLEKAAVRDTSRNHVQSQMALYGLARHSSVPEVNRFLSDVLTGGDDLARGQTLRMLSIVNDSSARMLMRSVDPTRTGTFTRRQIQGALSQPALPRGAGRMCAEGTRVLQSEDGDFRCLEK